MVDGTSLGVLNNARFAVWDPVFDNSGELEDGRIRGLLEHELNVSSDVLADSGCKVLLHAELGIVAHCVVYAKTWDCVLPVLQHPLAHQTLHCCCTCYMRNNVLLLKGIA